MRLDYLLSNAWYALLAFSRRFIFLLAPLVGAAISIKLYAAGLLQPYQNIYEIILSLSGTFAGFLFTVSSILITLPKNLFVVALQESGYIMVIHKTVLFGVLLFISTIIFGFSWNHVRLVIACFGGGIAELVVSVYFLYQVTALSGKSK